MTSTESLPSVTFTLERRLDAPPERVYRAWTEEAALKAWFGPVGFPIASCSLDLRPGGRFLYGMRNAEGQEVWGRWIFTEIEPGRRLSFIVSFSDAEGGVTRHPMAPGWPAEMASSVTFMPEGEGTRLVLESAPLRATAEEEALFSASHDSLRMGWGGTFGQLAEFLKGASSCPGETMAPVEIPAAARKALRGPIPHLNLDGASAAAAFYARAFGAEELYRVPAPDGRRLLHCHLRINGGSLMLCDVFPEYGHTLQTPQGFVLHLQVPDVEAAWARAVEAGAEVAMPLQDMFWGDRYGQLRDPFGVLWSLAQPIR